MCQAGGKKKSVSETHQSTGWGKGHGGWGCESAHALGKASSAAYVQVITLGGLRDSACPRVNKTAHSLLPGRTKSYE